MIIANVRRRRAVAVEAATQWQASSLALPGTVTFARTSTALYLTGSDYTAANLAYASAAANAPRFERLPSNAIGWLLEGQSINSCAHSYALNNVTTWGGSATKTLDQPGFTGAANTACVLQDNSAVAFQGVNLVPLTGLSSAATSMVARVFSLKDAVTSRFPALGIYMNDGTADHQHYVSINTSTGVIFSLGGPTTVILPTDFIFDRGDWWEWGFYGTKPALCTVLNMSLQPANALTPTGNDVSAVGSLTVAGIEFHFGGVAIPTSPIQTNGAAGTRTAETAAETASSPGAGFAVQFRARTAAGRISGTDQYLWSLDNGSGGTNRIQIRRSGATGNIILDVFSGGASQANVNGAVVPDNTEFEVAATIATNSMNLAVDGAAGTRNTSGTLPSGLTNQRFGTDHTGANHWNGHILGMQTGPVWLFPQATDAALIALNSQVNPTGTALAIYPPITGQALGNHTAPGGGPTVWQASSLTLPGTVTFARTGAAMYLTGSPFSSANYASVATDAPRFERLSSGAIGWLGEGQTTNINTHSYDLTNATRWNFTGLRSLNQAGLTNAANTATLITDNSTSAIQGVGLVGITVPTAASSIVVRVYTLKDLITSRFPALGLYMVAGATPHEHYLSLNTNTGAIFNKGGPGSIAPTDYVKDCGKWWEWGFYGTKPLGVTLINYSLSPANQATLTGADSVTPTGAITVGNVEFDLGGVAISTSPVQSNGAAATRNAETAVETLTPPTSFAVQFSARSAMGRVGDQYLWSLDNGTVGTNRIQIKRNSAGLVSMDVVTTGSLTNISSGVTIADNTDFKVSASLATNSMNICVNSTVGVRNTTKAMPTGLTTQRYFTDHNLINHWNGHIISMQTGPVWNAAMNDAALIALNA